MKKLSFALLVLLTQNLFAQEKRIQSEIESVKIYTQGAEVLRKAKTTLNKGNTLIIVENISSDIQTSSIQIYNQSNIEILSINHAINHNKTIDKNSRINEIEDSMKQVSNKIALLRIEINSLDHESSILSSNKSFNNTSSGINNIEFVKFLDIQRNRLNALNKEKYVNNQKIQELTEALNALQFSLNEEKNKLKEANGEIRLMVYSPNPNTLFSFGLSYLANVAGWIPVYDIKTEGPAKKSTLVYKAEIAQNTGENWNNVKLSLSSANPSLGLNLPELKPAYLSFVPPLIQKGKSSTQKKLNYANSSIAMEDSDLDGVSDKKDVSFKGSRTDGTAYFIDGVRATSKPLNTNTTSNEVVIEFSIPLPYTIPNDGQGRVVNIKDFDFPMVYEYFSVPKKECAVFLTGLSTDWQKLNLLPGNANMYFNNNYSGQMYLNPSPDNDTLALSFGRDKRILVERKILKDFSQKSFLGSTKKETFTFEIIVNNTNDFTADVKIQDQIPISTNAEIKVEIEDISDAKQNIETGVLEWKLALKAKETKKLKVIYSVTSPKTKRVY
jgi:uncharacterized protein (TIGR02231 family)